MPNRGSVNRRTGKTTPRPKVKTHWGAKGSVVRSSASRKQRTAAAAGPSNS